MLVNILIVLVVILSLSTLIIATFALVKNGSNGTDGTNGENGTGGTNGTDGENGNNSPTIVDVEKKMIDGSGNRFKMNLHSSVTYLYCNENVIDVNIEILLENTKYNEYIINCMFPQFVSGKNITILLGEKAVVHIKSLSFLTIILQRRGDTWNIFQAGDYIADQIIFFPTTITESKGFLDKNVNCENLAFLVLLHLKKRISHFFLFDSWTITGQEIKNVLESELLKKYIINKTVIENVLKDIQISYTSKDFKELIYSLIDTSDSSKP
jgi:hypothetical protein